MEKMYFKPQTIDEALEISKNFENDFSYVAGGTDLMMNIFHGNEKYNCLIDISNIKNLSGISDDEKYLRIGAITRLGNLKRSRLLTTEFPAILLAAASVGTPVIRKTGTIGGNILCQNRCEYYNQSEWWKNAAGHCLKSDGDICLATGGTKGCFSKFVSDIAPVLISLNAEIEILGKEGKEIIPLEKIYTGDGIRPKNLKKNDLIVSIIIEKKKVRNTIFKKLRWRESVDFTSLTTAVSFYYDNTVKVVLGGVDPGPVIVYGKSGYDSLKLIEEAQKKCRTIDNDVFSRTYRKKMIGKFLLESFK